MQRRTAYLTGLAAIVGVIIATAFAAAPWSCSGGFEFYFWFGVAVLLGLFVLPFVLKIGASLARRGALALGVAGLSGGAWIVGLFVANVRFLCKLF